MITILLLMVMVSIGFWLFSLILNVVFHPVRTVKRICQFVGFVVLLFLGLAML